MSNPKEEVTKLLESIPEEASYEDIQYDIYVRQKFDQGLEDVRKGRTLSQEEVKMRMARWLEKSNGQK